MFEWRRWLRRRAWWDEDRGRGPRRIRVDAREGVTPTLARREPLCAHMCKQEELRASAGALARARFLPVVSESKPPGSDDLREPSLLEEM
jgi:hypothetical protein